MIETSTPTAIAQGSGLDSALRIAVAAACRTLSALPVSARARPRQSELVTNRSTSRVQITGPAAACPSSATSSGTPMKPLFGKAATSAPKAASFSWTLAPCVTAMVKETITSAAARYTPSTPGFNSSSTGVFMPKRNNMQGRAKKSTKPFKPGIAASASRPRHAAR